jgi:cytochrome c oxidase subunit 1
MNETLGRWHFWLTIAGAYATFLPMHLAGLGGEPRHYAQLNGIANAASDLLSKVAPIQIGISHAAFFLATAQLLFLVNLAISFRRGKLAPDDPWFATTLEWAPTDRRAGASKHSIVVYRGPCEYFHSESGIASKTQWASTENPE